MRFDILMGTGNQGRTRNQPLRRAGQGDYPSGERIPRLASQSKSEAIALATPSQGFRSSKTIDLWCLALCSCTLTLLCHSLTSAPQTSSTYSPQSSSQTSSPISTAGTSFRLFTLTSSRPEIEEEQS